MIDSDDWFWADLSGEQIIRMYLLDANLRSAQIAYSCYRQAVRELRDTERSAAYGLSLAKTPHHAKTFVCAMRRVARLLEALSSHRSIFPQAVSETIKLVWRKKRKMLEAYRKTRDAIEHIDGEVGGKTSWKMMNLWGNRLAVMSDEEHQAEISDRNLRSVIEGRNDMVELIVDNVGRPAE